jgi:hypothetical protein
MSERSSSGVVGDAPRRGQTADAGEYEPPHLTYVGNARDLLAGGSGTVTDGNPTLGKPSQSGGTPGM